ncbi:diacylglycerol/lipid kinase family protein [Nonomuraea pusilla]|uniref:Diacylglycerol kinase family enzyme n=1 Tax=Nonomuraea pusilla TaxID=46177 RepID=A0A1H7WS55_9ACTN|nr:diacylglycerol kinase family protein [Nonomuraea pusilla]SEM24372.1 Diacylglycerol kinase family enzyme [Nonomuraea pusilla]
MRKLVALGNPAAGGVDGDARRAVLEVLRGGADVEDVVLRSPGDLDAALDAHADRVPVVLGGDGTLHAVVAALLRRGEPAARPVGLVPLGTGNDLARALGVPLEPRAAARIVLDGRERPLDLLVDERGGVVVNAVHIGVGALASERAAPLKPVLRRAAYPAGALIAGVRGRGWRLRVTVDGQVVGDGRRRVLMVGVGNGTSIGGGTPLMPGARPDDGLADVVVSYTVPPWSRLAFALLLRLGRHQRRDDVLTFRAREVRVEGEPAPANADGEPHPPAPRRSWTVHPAAWRLIAPVE